MFEVGQYIVYGTNGVCRVEAVGRPDFAADRLYYTLLPLSGTETIYIPVDSPVFMRPVISREQAEALIASIPSIEEDEPETHSARTISVHYQAALQSHDCHDLVQLIKTVYAKNRRSSHLSMLDQRYCKRAMELLHGELSIALGIPAEQVPAYISRTIGAQQA